MTTAERYRYIYKPLLFVACLIPLAWLTCQALGQFGSSLGADPVKKVEHFCGKTALNLLMLTLLVTPVSRLTGWRQAIRFRRMFGLFTFFYALLHFTVYVSLDLEFDFGTVAADIAKRPYITIGFFALMLMVPLAATSTDAIMRRLGRAWVRLHRLIYLIAILAVWHYYWQVKRDVREPLIYSGVLAALLGYRFFR